mmetsp:Transcript_48470/g.149747  ORF Transcript_48470/g.149747 Transcript_48470/m.149747 type:complete len:276 (+) Transcript_48470:690-1517(+)
MQGEDLGRQMLAYPLPVVLRGGQARLGPRQYLQRRHGVDVHRVPPHEHGHAWAGDRQPGDVIPEVVLVYDALEEAHRVLEGQALGQELLRGRLPQRGEARALATQQLREAARGALPLRGAREREEPRGAGAALEDRAAEEAVASGQVQVVADGEGAGALAPHRDPLGVAGEGANVPPDPAEGLLLVEQAVDAAVRGRARVLLGDLVERQEAEGAEPVVQGHHDHSRGRQGAAIEPAACALHHSAAVDKHVHRQRRGGGPRCPHVEEEAVFGALFQ